MNLCDGDEDEDMIDCLACQDTGETLTPAGWLVPCSDCERGVWNDYTERTADMAAGR